MAGHFPYTYSEEDEIRIASDELVKLEDEIWLSTWRPMLQIMITKQIKRFNKRKKQRRARCK